MGAQTSPSARRRWLRLGPGTIIALIVAVAALASGRLNEPNKAALSAGRVVYEADAQGRMRRVDAAAPPPRPLALPRLWKPEPRMVLDRQSELHLTSGQRRTVAALDAGWRHDRAQLEAEMQPIATRAGQGAGAESETQGVSMAQLRQGLADYSELSRAYDARRADYWQRAVAVLTARQRRTMERAPDASRRSEVTR